MTVLQMSTDQALAAPSEAALPPSMVERMTLILEAFPTTATRMTLEQVARVTRLPRSTTHRILDQLVRLSWLAHSSAGYTLGARSLGLGGANASHSDLREAAAPVLHELQVRTGLVAHLAVLDGAEIRYLDKVGGRSATIVPSRVGGRAPANCTALGKSMLAWLQPEDVEVLLSSSLGRQTSSTICDIELLHFELDRIRRRRGLAFERGECFSNIACVAAAVRGPHGPVGAISLVGDAQTPLERVAVLVVEAARSVTRELYPNMPLHSGQRARVGRPLTAVAV